MQRNSSGGGKAVKFHLNGNSLWLGTFDHCECWFGVFDATCRVWYAKKRTSYAAETAYFFTDPDNAVVSMSPDYEHPKTRSQARCREADLTWKKTAR